MLSCTGWPSKIGSLVSKAEGNLAAVTVGAASKTRNRRIEGKGPAAALSFMRGTGGEGCRKNMTTSPARSELYTRRVSRSLALRYGRLDW